MNEIIVATIALTSMVLGVILQYSLSKHFYSVKHLKELETQSYIDFIKASAGINSAQRNNDAEKENEYNLLMMDAKARICVYGTSETITALADFWRKSGKLEKKEDLCNFLNAIKSIRKTTGLKDRILDKDMSQLLFGRDL